MEKVRPWCGQPSDRGRLRNRNRILVQYCDLPGEPACPDYWTTAFLESRTSNVEQLPKLQIIPHIVIFCSNKTKKKFSVLKSNLFL